MTLLREKISPQEQKNILLAMEKHTKERQEEIFSILREEYWEDATIENLIEVNNRVWNPWIHLIDPRLNPEWSMETFPAIQDMWPEMATLYSRMEEKSPQNLKVLFKRNLLDAYHTALHNLLWLHHHWFDELALRWWELWLYWKSFIKILSDKIIWNEINNKRPKLVEYLHKMSDRLYYQDVIKTDIIRPSISPVVKNPKFDQFAISRDKFLKTVISALVLDTNIINLTGKRAIWLPIEQFLNLPVFKIMLSEKDKAVIDDIVSGEYITKWLSDKYQPAVEYAQSLEEQRATLPRRFGL